MLVFICIIFNRPTFIQPVIYWQMKYYVLQAEYEWDGDRRRGLGDYRIPKTLLTDPSGKHTPANEIAPNKGILRYELISTEKPTTGFDLKSTEIF